MDSKKVLMPNGEVRTYFCGDEQTWAEVVEKVILPHWIQYCERNWISPNHEAVYAPEKRVKWFLDRLGWLLISGSDDIESEYKNMVHTVREIPVTECPAEISDLMYSDRHVTENVEDNDGQFDQLLERLAQMDKRKKKAPNKPRKKTKFERITEIERRWPDAEMTWCNVDEGNCFEYHGTSFAIPTHMVGYSDDRRMDRVLAVETDTRLVFYDQDVVNMFFAA